MGLRATGDQSLPVRLNYALNASRWRFEELEDRVSHIPEALDVSVERRSPDEQRGCLAKATLPRRWVFRSNAEACMNNAVALQRQPYLGVGCFD